RTNGSAPLGDDRTSTSGHHPGNRCPRARNRKGRKERCTPIARPTLVVLKGWLREPQRGDGNVLFPNVRGQRLSVHGVQCLLNKHRGAASRVCPSSRDKRVTVHRLRHTTAMDLLQGGA